MPGGETHGLATTTVFVVSIPIMIGLGYYGYMHSLYWALAILVGIAITFLINPDLDLNRRFPRKDPKQWLWWIYWFPYSRAIPHRSLLSHSPVGTVIRFVYAFWSVLLIMWYNNANGYAWFLVGMILLGATVSDAVHVLLDFLMGEKGHL